MVKITGADKFAAKLRGAAGKKVVRLVGDALRQGGEMIRSEAHVMIGEGSSSGQSGGKHQHVRSRPGEPPNRELGTLQAGLETTQTAPLRVEVSSNAPYAVPLEAGTSKMLPRPYMGPATRRKKKEVVALVRQAVNKALKEK